MGWSGEDVARALELLESIAEDVDRMREEVAATREMVSMTLDSIDQLLTIEWRRSLSE